MAETANQRWREGDPFWVDPDQCIDPSEFDVVELDGDRIAKEFITTHHYSRSYPAARWRFGLYRSGVLVGVAVYSHPTNNSTVTRHFGADPRRGVELGRFVLLPEVKGNGESWFLARTFELLRRRNELDGVVAFSDPMARRRLDGTWIKPGHIGTIYQALDSVPLGRSKARRIWLTPAGLVYNERTYRKARNREQGWEYAVRQLLGVVPDPEDIDRLLEQAVRQLRQVHHPGNLKYGWKLDRQEHRLWLPLVRCYPKKEVLC